LTGKKTTTQGDMSFMLRVSRKQQEHGRPAAMAPEHMIQHKVIPAKGAFQKGHRPVILNETSPFDRLRTGFE